MDLEQILDLIRQGISDKELRPLMKQFVEEYPEYREVGLLGDALRQSGLSEAQQAQFGQVHGKVMLGGGSILEETPIMALGGAGVAALKKGAGKAVVSEVVGGEVIEGTAKAVTINPSVINRIASGILKFLPKSTLGRVTAGAGLLGAFGLATGESKAPGPPAPPESQVPGITQQPVRRQGRTTAQGRLTQPESELSQLGLSGYNVLVIDHNGSLTGTPGALAVLAPQDLGIPEGIPAGGTGVSLGPEIAGTTDGSVDWLNFLSSAIGGSAAGFQANEPRVHQALFPATMGDVRISTPTQVGGSTTLRSQLGMGAGFTPVEFSQGHFFGSIGTALPSDEIQRTVPQNVTVPANAELQPRAFDNYRGRTLIEWASLYAKKHGVPLNVLYGVIAHESGWNPNAVGDNGQSHGLAQIYQPTWGDQISPESARNPIFALNWTAQMLRERFNHYGRWDAAVAAHNSPVAANYLAETGKFQNEKSARYVNDVMNRANRSGLDNYIADEGLDTEIDSGGGAGPTVSPFEKPDPAATRAYVRSVYEELLGRQPTENEFVEEIKKVEALSRQSYESKVRAALGSETTQVDVGAQFEESIRGLGEFDWQQEMLETNSFTDHTASIARLLQSGI